MPRKLRWILVQPAFYVELCKGRGFATRRVKPIANVLPDDAQFVDCKTIDTGEVCILISSESFDDLKDDAVVPQHPTTVFENAYQSERKAIIAPNSSTKH